LGLLRRLNKRARWWTIACVSNSRGANQRIIITHAVLTGLTPLIPIPLLDDLAKAYFQRRLVRKLSAAYGQVMSEQDVKALADDPDSGCRGCLGTALVYPLKIIFRKIFFFLEWKRAIDTVSHTYYQGYLVEHAFKSRWCSPLGPRTPAQIRWGIDTVLSRVNTSLIERAVRGTFRQSKGAVKGAARLLGRSLRRVTRRASEEEVGRAIEAVEQQEEREIEGVIAQLQNAIEAIPAEHFQKVRAELAAALGLPPG
jgi:hypothetical protein